MLFFFLAYTDGLYQRITSPCSDMTRDQPIIIRVMAHLQGWLVQSQETENWAPT